MKMLALLSALMVSLSFGLKNSGNKISVAAENEQKIETDEESNQDGYLLEEFVIVANPDGFMLDEFVFTADRTVAVN